MEDGPLLSPFDELGPSPLARQAAEALAAQLRKGALAPGLSTQCLYGPDGGKMFGVLVVRAPDGALDTLRAFSGKLAGRWELEGFVPPAFDAAAREAVEPAGDALVKALLAREETFERGELSALRAAREALLERHAREEQALRQAHEERKARRHALREGGVTPERAAALEQESRTDRAQRRHQKADRAQAQAELEARLRPLERRLAAMQRLRRVVCREIFLRLLGTYVLTNARGERRTVSELFGGVAPGGAGDCCAPKLLAAAYARGLRPLALAELWWGAPPATGGRVEGGYYPACKEKCGPLLGFMLEGLEVAPPRRFSPAKVHPSPLRVLFEDATLVVVDKPVGLLSIPGKDARVEDSVLRRLRERYPDATGPLLAHRLDLDTSGLLAAALRLEAYVALQRQFAAREVEKRYVAWVEGTVARDAGEIDLPIRVDLADRPRQIHDPVHGRRAVTRFEVLERASGRTRVALFPLTGRTHQLRVHAAHPLGLGAPIVGDRLYGHEGQRLLLHAERLTLRHPLTGERLHFESPAPF